MTNIFFHNQYHEIYLVIPLPLNKQNLLSSTEVEIIVHAEHENQSLNFQPNLERNVLIKSSGLNLKCTVTTIIFIIFWDFLTFYQISLSLQRKLRKLHGRGLRSLQSPVPLPAARWVQRGNDVPVKVLNLLFFVYFVWKWGETFKKLPFFTFGPKQCF